MGKWKGNIIKGKQGFQPISYAAPKPPTAAPQDAAMVTREHTVGLSGDELAGDVEINVGEERFSARPIIRMNQRRIVHASVNDARDIVLHHSSDSDLRDIAEAIPDRDLVLPYQRACFEQSVSIFTPLADLPKEQQQVIATRTMSVAKELGILPVYPG